MSEAEFDKIFEKMQVNKQCFFPIYRIISEVSHMIYFVFSMILYILLEIQYVDNIRTEHYKNT